MLNIEEEIRAETESHVFTIFCEEEIKKILLRSKRKEADYLKVYVFLHFVLEIRISFLFRSLLYGHVFLKTSHSTLLVEDLDRKDIKEKFDLLNDFYLVGITRNDVNKLSGWFNNFAEKRNKIVHGYKNGITYDQIKKESKIAMWVNDNELKKHFKSYQEIISLFRRCIDKMPALTPSGKNDFKNELIDFSISF